MAVLRFRGIVFGKGHLDSLALSVLGLLVLWFCQDLVFKHEVPFYRDLGNYFYPLRFSLYESYRAGELLLWDRRFAQGFPNLAAFQPGVFYPPHLILYFLPFYAAIRALFVLHFLVGATGAYCLLRSWKYPIELSLVGSLMFTFGGVIVSFTNLLNHFQSAVWLPWMILSWEHMISAPKWRSLVSFVILASLQLLAGSPEIFAMSIGLAVVAAFRLRRSMSDMIRRQTLLYILGAAGLMIGLTMAQLLPTAELLLESRRAVALPASETLMWSLTPSSILNFVLPDKEVDMTIPSGLRLFFAGEPPLIVSTYLGVITLFGSFLWLYYAGYRDRLYMAAVILCSLALALGGNALVYPFLLQHFSWVSIVRFPEKFLFVTYALVVVAAISGLGSFMVDRTQKVQFPVLILSVFAVALLGLYLWLTFHSDIVSDLIAAASRIPPLSDIHANATVSVLTNLQRQVILSLALVFLLGLVKAEKVRPFLFSVALVAIVFIDLAWANRSFLFPADPARVYEDRPVVTRRETQFTRLFYYPSSQDLHPASFSVLGRPTFEQSVALSYQNYLPNVGIQHGIEYFQEIDALNRSPYMEFLRIANQLDFKSQVKLMGVFNIGYLVSFRPLPQTGIQLVGHFPEYFSWLYKVEQTVPRVYMVKEAIVERDPVKTLNRLSDPEFDSSRQVVLHEHVSLAAPAQNQADAEIERYENKLVAVRTSSDGSAVLVLTDAFYPGWKAYVDGREKKIIRANHFYRAIEVPEGEHRVVFKYEPFSVILGMLISGITLVGIVIISGVLWLRDHGMRRRKNLVLSRSGKSENSPHVVSPV